MNTTAAKPAGRPADETPVQVDDPATVETLRGQIDALDAAITRLVAERAQLSRRIQTARMNAGGTRVELGRERAIVDHYRAPWAALARRWPRQCCGSAGASGNR